MAYFSEINLPRFREEDLPGTTKKLYNVVRELQEMLQFVLSNLDGDNIEGYEEIFNRLEGAEGAVSILKQTADQIYAEVRKNADQIASLDIRADGITQRVIDVEKGVGELKVTADQISARVSDNEGNIGALQVTARDISARVSDNEGNIGALSVRADGIAARVSDSENNIAALEIRADGIAARVSDNEGDIAALDVTAKGLAARVADSEGDITDLQVTAQGLAARVSGAEGDIADLEVTAQGLRTRVSNTEGDISTLTQTANGLASRVTSAEGDISVIEQTAEGISSRVTDLNGKYTSLKQTVDGFDFTGLVSFSDLSGRGKSDIDGRNITTGKISLERLELENDYGYITMGTGSTGYFSTRGIRVAGPPVDDLDEFRNHLLATNAGIRIVGEDKFGYESIWLSGDEIEATSVISTSSDERVKNGIAYDVAERYGAFYKALKPARYHMNTSRSGRFHTGFVAQQVRDALEAAGLGRGDLAALVQQGYDPQAEDGGGGQYSIRYGELVALNTAMVQSLMARVDALETKLKEG